MNLEIIKVAKEKATGKMNAGDVLLGPIYTSLHSGKKGHKLETFGKTYGGSLAGSVAGSAAGAIPGAGIGALAAKIMKKNPKAGAAIGAMAGAIPGGIIGKYRGHAEAKRHLARTGKLEQD